MKKGNYLKKYMAMLLAAVILANSAELPSCAVQERPIKTEETVEELLETEEAVGQPEEPESTESEGESTESEKPTGSEVQPLAPEEGLSDPEEQPAEPEEGLPDSEEQPAEPEEGLPDPEEQPAEPEEGLSDPEEQPTESEMQTDPEEQPVGTEEELPDLEGPLQGSEQLPEPEDVQNGLLPEQETVIDEVGLEPPDEEVDYVLGRPMTEEEEEEQWQLIQEHTSRLVPLEADEAVESVLDDTEPMVRAGSLPSSYTLDDIRGRITEVKDQSPYGTCWAFSTINAAEASLISQGLASASSVDLSERHLAYYTGYSVTDPLGGTVGDSNTYAGTLNSLLNAGGNYTRAIRTLSMWMGAVNEQEAPYSQVGTPLPNTQAAAYGKNAAILKNAYGIHKSDEALIKQAIMEHGAAGIMYYAAEGRGNGYYNVQTAAQYCNNSSLQVNHGVSIVGWDDNYSKSNFIIEPEAPGAWLVKNSWGNYFGNDGYFWLSYEDATINDTFFVIEMQESGQYDNNYQYDGSLADAYLLFDESVQMANVFTAVANNGKKESLKAVSFLSGAVNCSYSIQIYKNPLRPDDPTSGTPVLASPQSGQAAYDGYYTIPLNQPIELSQGEQFAVVITLTKADGNLKVMMESTRSGSWNSIASVAPGQSFYRRASYGKWQDAADIRSGGNFRIRAFTSNLDLVSEDVAVNGITMQETSGSIHVGETKQLTATVTPPNATNKAITWNSSNSSVATVSSAGLVKGLKKGETVITASTADGKCRAEYRLTVTEPYESVRISGSAVLDQVGSIYQFYAIVSPGDAPDKTVTWSSSDSSVVKVDRSGKVTAVGTGKAVIKATANGDNRITGTMEVTVPLNSTNQVRSFVVRMYTNVLLRDAEKAGLDDWSGRLISKTADGAALAQGFIGSDEFKNKDVGNQAYVEILYKTFFNRDADNGGKAYWLKRLENGLSRDYVLRGFVNSDEFQKLCDAYGINRGEMQVYANRDQNEGLTMFVNRLYVKALGRAGEEKGIEDWTGRILRREETAGNVAKSFFFSDEFTNKRLNDREYVKTLYRTFMDREYDQAGLNDWVSRLAGGAGRETVLSGFVNSEEFGNIMKSYGVN